MVRYHLTPVTMAALKRTKDAEKKEILVHCRWECKLMPPLWKTVWTFLYHTTIKLKNLLKIYFKMKKQQQ